MNTYRDTYAVQVINRKKAGKPPRYLKGFNSRPEAEDKMNHLYSKDTYKFKVVYIRECINDDVHHQGPPSTITEIPEYYSI
jgi:hypothetical protein